MGFLDDVKVRATAVEGRIVLPEGADERVVEAAAQLVRDETCKVVVLADAASRTQAHDELESIGVEVVDPAVDSRVEGLAQTLFERRKHKGLTLDAAQELATDPMFFAALLVATGQAEGTVGGAVHTTADTVRSALQSIGAKPGLKTVSSAFVMVHPDNQWGDNGIMVFSDCAVLPDPNPAQLAEIAIGAAETYSLVVGGDPRVALLSFSTKGSAKHALVDKVQAAVAELEQRNPDFSFDGDLQLDAALLPTIGERKAPGSGVAGKANVLVFPDLNAGNICYKAVERLGGAVALGPLLQGLARPANDLSRGCSAADIVQTSWLTLLQSQTSR
ncbi:MAG: phosphate acetyltransferase [bacterium]|nr:phosphate acetyltransferase [bacterium]